MSPALTRMSSVSRDLSVCPAFDEEMDSVGTVRTRTTAEPWFPVASETSARTTSESVVVSIGVTTLSQRVMVVSLRPERKVPDAGAVMLV